MFSRPERDLGITCVESAGLVVVFTSLDFFLGVASLLLLADGDFAAVCGGSDEELLFTESASFGTSAIPDGARCGINWCWIIICKLCWIFDRDLRLGSLLGDGVLSCSLRLSLLLLLSLISNIVMSLVKYLWTQCILVSTHSCNIRQ